MLRPVCIKCHRFFRPKQNGFAFIEGMRDSYETQPGIEHDAHWRDYRLWHGDLYECHGCGTQIITGIGREPLAEHYQEDFADHVKSWRATFRVDDQ